MKLARGHLLALELDRHMLNAHAEEDVVRLIEDALLIARLADDGVGTHRDHA